MTCNCIGGNPCPCQRGVMGQIIFGPRPQFDWPTGAAPQLPNGEILKDLLAKAATHVMTPKEIYEQRVSWLRGMTGKLSDPMPTREQAVKALEVLGIVDPDSLSHGDSQT